MKSHLVWIRREICTDQALFTSDNNHKSNCEFWCEKKIGDGVFHWRKHHYELWTSIFTRNNDLKLKCLNYLFGYFFYYTFFTNMQLLTLRKVNWWTGVVWISVMFLSAVWALILTAPIHCKGSIGEQVMQNFSKTVPMKNVSVTCVTPVPWRRERRRNVRVTD